MNDQIPSIRTPFLVLQARQPGDADVLQRIYQSKDVLQYFPNPNSPLLETVERFYLDHIIALAHPHNQA
jgi:hypothetical protein